MAYALSSPSNHTPKEIFQAACDELGRYFAPDGLRYFGSRPRLEQKRGDLTLTMAMWSSRFNIPGEQVALEVVSTVSSRRLAKWIKQSGVGRNNAIFSVDTHDPTTGKYEKYFNVFNTAAGFVEMAERIRTVCWAPMDCIGADGSVPSAPHPKLVPITDNLACWLWMNGERQRALALPDLEPELVARLSQLG